MAETDVMNSRVARFQRENPEFWTVFVRYTLNIINTGMPHYSARAVIDRVRWHYLEAGKRLRITNDLSPHFARQFHMLYPQHDGFFHCRPLKKP